MCSITTLSKVSYFPIFALPLVIPKSKFESAKSKKWYIAGSILIGIICFAIATLYAGKMGMTQWPIPGVNVADQLRYIVFNPIKYLYIFGKLMIGNLFVLLQGATTNLAYCGILENGLGLLSIILILFTFSINKDLRLTKFQKITFLLISIACLGATATTLYLTFTPVGANSISGFQGRYMLPVLSMLFVGLSGSIESKAKYSKIETGILILILSLIMISALKIIGAYYL